LYHVNVTAAGPSLYMGNLLWRKCNWQ